MHQGTKLYRNAWVNQSIRCQLMLGEDQLTLERISGKVRSHVQSGNCHLLTIFWRRFLNLMSFVAARFNSLKREITQHRPNYLEFDRKSHKTVIVVVTLEGNWSRSWWPATSNTSVGVPRARLWHVGFFCDPIVSWWLVGKPMGGAMVCYGIFWSPIGGRRECFHSWGPPLVTDCLR